MKKILFVCLHNSGRSQMAEAFMKFIARDRVIAFSAGTQPAREINPTVVRVMREIGIDIGTRIPKLLNPKILYAADKVISMGCDVQQACPAFILPMEDWKTDDPEGKSVEKVRKIRDEIKNRVKKVAREIN